MTGVQTCAFRSIKDALARDFYADMCRVEQWSVRQLRERIDSMLYKRTALSKKAEALIRQELTALRDKDELSPALVFRDPYMLDFLDLADAYKPVPRHGVRPILGLCRRCVGR